MAVEGVGLLRDPDLEHKDIALPLSLSCPGSWSSEGLDCSGSRREGREVAGDRVVVV